MAKAISDEEIQLRKRARRRLVGAIALVTLMIVLVPMVLDREPKPPNSNISVQIPSPNTGGFVSKVAPPLPPAPAEIKPPPAVEKVPVTPPSPPVERPVASHTEVQKESATPPTDVDALDTEAPPKKPTPRPVPSTEAKPKAPSAPPTSGGGSYVVQLGAFNDAKNAKQLQDRLTENQIQSYTEVIKTSSGEKVRVRAGPYATHEQAEQARDKLKLLGVEGIVANQKAP